jgi:adsorption protein B
MGRWALWRDRKALWSNPLVFIAWTLIAFLMVLGALNPNWMSRLRFPNMLLVLMYTNLAFFAFRLVQRARFTTRLYGIQHGILSLPRLILGCVINGMSAIKAIKQFGKATKDKAQDKIIWDKTDHFFPTEEELNRSMLQ